MVVGPTYPNLEEMELIGKTPVSNGLENLHKELHGDARRFLREKGIFGRYHRSSYDYMYGGRGYQGIKLNEYRDNKLVRSYYAVVYDNDQRTLHVYAEKEETEQRAAVGEVKR